MEIERGRAECPDEGERQGFFLVHMNISDQREKAKEIAQVSRGETHHPCPHLLC